MSSKDEVGESPARDDEQDTTDNEMPTELTRNKSLERADYSNYVTHFENPYTKQVQRMDLHVHDVINAVLNDEWIPIQDPDTGRQFNVSLDLVPESVEYRRLSDDKTVTKDIDSEPITVQLGGQT